MKFAINPATTMPYDIEADVAAYHTAGIEYMELWIAKLKKYLQEHELAQFKDLLAEKGISIVGACAMGNLPVEDIKGNPDRLAELKLRLGYCQALGCPSMVITPGEFAEPVSDAHGIMVKNLRSAADVAADFGVKLALEFLQGSKLIGTLGTSKQVVRQARHPNLGLIIDCAHFWMDRSDLSDVDDLQEGELLLVHLADIERQVAAEAATDNDREFPGKGKGIENRLIPAIRKTGYDGFWSVELFNKKIWQKPIESIAADCVECFDYVERNYATG